MSKSKKPRKAYRPKPLRDPIAMAIGGVATFSEAQRAYCMDMPNAAYEKLRTGRATRDDWNVVRQAINIAEALTEQDIGNNLLPDFDAAHRALHNVAMRHLEGGSLVCRGEELMQIREGLDMYAVQLEFVSQAEFDRAIQRVKNLLKGGKVEEVKQTYARANERGQQ